MFMIFVCSRMQCALCYGSISSCRALVFATSIKAAVTLQLTESPSMGICHRVQSLFNQSLYILRLKADQRAGQLSLPHVGITKTEIN